MLLCYSTEKFVLKFGFKKRGIFNKIPISMDIPGKGLHHLYHQASSLIGNQANHRTNMFLSYLSNSCYESDHECICIVINVKIRSVPLNILSSVESLFKGFAANMYAPKLFIVALIVVEK